jgi:hypothetical protein
MLSQVSKGLLIFLHGNWPWVGDAAFEVLNLCLDLAPRSGDIAR